MRGPYTWGARRIKEKVGLSAGGGAMYGGGEIRNVFTLVSIFVTLCQV